MAKVNENGVLREATCKEELRAMRDSWDILGGKWKLMIVRYLTSRKEKIINFKDLLQGLDGISAKMLSKELKDLEINLLVTRTVVDSHPVTVEYRLTEYGQSVYGVTETLVEWGLSHRDKIIKG